MAGNRKGGNMGAFIVLIVGVAAIAFVGQYWPYIVGGVAAGAVKG